MKKIYVYIDREFLVFYLSDRLRAPSELHPRDRLYGEFDREDALTEAELQLLGEGYDLIPCDGQSELVKKYVPARLVEWPRIIGKGEDFRHHMLYADSSPEEIAQSLWAAVFAGLSAYGPDATSRSRVEQEWQTVKRNGNLLEIAVLHEITSWMRQAGQPYWLPGSSGASFILYLLGITRNDPLRPRRDLLTPAETPPASDGFEPDGAGQGIPWQILWGDDRPSWFEVRLPFSMQQEVKAWLRRHWLFRLRPELPLTYPTSDRIHFSYIQLSFTIDDAEPSLNQTGTGKLDLRARKHYLRSKTNYIEYLLFKNEYSCG